MPPKGNRCGSRQAGRHASRLQNKHVLRIHKLAATNSAQICRCKSEKNKKNKTNQNKAENKIKDFVARKLYQRQLFPTTRMTQPRRRMESVQL
jgi:hypothetical protein